VHTPYAVPITARIAFHIGYHKTATTWFQRAAMPQHPDIRPLFTEQPTSDPLLRELVLTPRHSFDVDRARAALDARLAELGVPDDAVALGSQERLSGHAATGGFDTFDIAERIALVAPGASVFAVVREQVAMIESEYLQLLQEGSLRRLDRLLASSPTLSSMPVFDLRQYEYDRLADHYVQLLGRTSHRLFEFDALRADPRGFLDALAAYLGIAPWPALGDDSLRRRFNPTVPRRLLESRRFLNHFERRPLNPDPVLAVPPVWRGPLWWLAAHWPGRARPVIDAGRAAELRDRYRASNARLAERHGITFACAR
jgi:hypothetical protein